MENNSKHQSNHTKQSTNLSQIEITMDYIGKKKTLQTVNSTLVPWQRNHMITLSPYQH